MWYYIIGLVSIIIWKENGKMAMRIFKRAAAGASAAAVALSLIIPVGASAEGENTVTLHYDGFADGSLSVEIDDGQSLSNTVTGTSYNNSKAILYPAPKNGKAIIGWKEKDSSEAFNIYGAVTKSLDLYPILADTVEADTIAVTADAAALPTVGADVPESVKDSITVPDGFTVVDAYYETDDSAFADNSVYYLRVEVMPSDGKAFDYTYNIQDKAVFSVGGATLNGEKAATSWDTAVDGKESVTITLPITLGDPETVKLTLHYNSHGGVKDKTIDVVKGDPQSAAMQLDQAAGELSPSDDDYAFVGWFNDAALTDLESYSSYYLTVSKDTDLYAKWAKVITELELTVETPLCGEVVEPADGKELPETIDYLTAGTADVNDLEDGNGEHITITNEPQVTANIEGVDVSGTWITTETPIQRVEAGTHVELFLGTIYGENDYTFVLNVETDEEGEAPYFAKDLKVTINGEPVGRGAAAEAAADLDFLARPSTKAGIVSNANMLKRGGNSFTVIGMITADHVWDDGVITTPAGCEEEGVRTYPCRSKDASYTDEIDAYGHKWLEWEVVKPATATEDGLEMRRCSNDGEHTETRIIPATGETVTPPESSSETPAPVGGNTAPSGTGTTAPATGGGAAAPLAAAALSALAVVIIRKKK